MPWLRNLAKQRLEGRPQDIVDVSAYVIRAPVGNWEGPDNNALGPSALTLNIVMWLSVGSAPSRHESEPQVSHLVPDQWRRDTPNDGAASDIRLFVDEVRRITGIGEDKDVVATACALLATIWGELELDPSLTLMLFNPTTNIAKTIDLVGRGKAWPEETTDLNSRESQETVVFADEENNSNTP